MENKLVVSIGIAAYNAEKNIKHMLTALTAQQESSYTIQKIIVHSDKGTDGTVAAAKQIVDPRVEVIENSERKGFAGAVQYLLKNCPGDVVILLNDDIKITDLQLIEKLVAPFLQEEHVGMVCGNLIPLPPATFIERVNVAGFQWWYNIRTHMDNAHTMLSVDGKLMAFSRAFIDKISFPDNVSEMGNVDNYMAMLCLSIGFKYRWAQEASVFFRNPTTWKEHFRFSIRNHSSIQLIAKQFGHQVDDHFGSPRNLYVKYLLLEFLKKPLEIIFLLGTTRYVLYKAKKESVRFDPKWEVISTAKKLD